MTPTAFDEDNTVLGPPAGMTEDDVASLSVFRGTTADGVPIVISAWKPDAEELAEVKRTGRVWVGVAGTTMPPLWVSGFKPEMKEPDE